MVVPRILTGQPQIDKLRYWIAVPLGAVVGAWMGHRLALPGIDLHDIIMAAGALALALLLGLSSPRATPPSALQPPSRQSRMQKRASR